MTDSNLKILAVGAHPSDIFVNIGGTVANHVDKGDEVVLVTLTYGIEVHTDKHVGKSEDEIRDVIYDQSMEAAQILGVSEYKFLDFGDTPLVHTRENLLELGQVIQNIKPDVIISAHYPLRETGWRIDHSEAAKMLELAPYGRVHGGLAPHKVKSIWFSATDYATGVDRIITSLPDTYVDITDTIDRKIDAIKATWATSVDDVDDLDSLFLNLHKSLGNAVGVEYAEAFAKIWHTNKLVKHLN